MKGQLFIIAIIVTMASCGASKKLESANAQINQLNGQITQMNGKISENDKQIADLKLANEINSKDAADCRIAKEALRKKKENLDRNLADRGTSLAQIEQRANDAIKRFEDAGCTVDYKNGRFHISIPDNFDFKSGSSNIGAKGRAALNVVAQVMYDNPGVQTVILGNTDTVKVKGVTDNWSLSTERANAVVRVLEDVYNINPKRLTAAGKSKFNPIASNDTPEGRTRNRRIEIIINPDFDRIWNLMED